MTKSQLNKGVAKRRCKTCVGSSPHTTTVAVVEKKWVQLVVGNQNPVVELVTVNGTQVVDLRRAVKEQMSELLTHCAAAELQVLLQGGRDAALDVEAALAELGDSRFLVRAPPRQGRYLC
jgi:hypothetical protein